jgi:hypothetical protein
MNSKTVTETETVTRKPTDEQLRRLYLRACSEGLYLEREPRAFGIDRGDDGWCFVREPGTSPRGVHGGRHLPRSRRARSYSTPTWRSRRTATTQSDEQKTKSEKVAGRDIRAPLEGCPTAGGQRPGIFAIFTGSRRILKDINHVGL